MLNGSVCEWGKDAKGRESKAVPEGGKEHVVFCTVGN